MLVTTFLVILALQVTQITPRDAPPKSGRMGTGAIRGRVLAVDTGAPMRRAIVTLMVMQPSQPSPPRNITTDADGRFEFSSLPAGTYRLRAMPGAYRSQYLASTYGGRRSNDPGRAIDLTAGQQFEQADIAMQRGGAIPGRVTDDFGDPVTRAMVFAARIMPGSTNFQRTGNFAQTDDQGRFRLYGLEPGEYVVAAEVRGSGGPPVDGETEGFATTYFPSALNEREAGRVRVAASADAGDVEIQLVRTRTFRVTGTVMNSKGQAVENPQVMLTRSAPGSGFTTTGGSMSMQGGKFTIRDVVPGDYRLVVRPMGPPRPDQEGTKSPRPEYATVPLSVASDIEDLVVMTQPGVSIVGRVVFAEGAPATLPSVRISAQPSDRGMMFGPPPNATSGADGMFTLNDLFGPQLVRGGVIGTGSMGTAPAYTLKAVMLGGTDITDTPVEFKAEHSRHLEIVLTSRASTVEGTVTDDAGAPARDVMVVMIPEDKAAWRVTSPRMRMGPPLNEGKFSIARVLPGRYHVIAVPREGFYLNPDTDPEVIAQMVKESTAVTVGEDEKRSVDLRVVRIAR